MTSLLFDSKAWAEEQFGHCDLADIRRTQRLVKLATAVVNHPSGSFPEQTESWSDVKAAYTLLARPEVTFEAVAGEHWRQTRARPAGRYLVLSDTTELDFGIRRAIPGLAPTGNGGGRGFLLHSALVSTAEGDALIGLAGQVIHYRKPKPTKENTTQRLKRDRESEIWGEVIDQVGPPPEGVEWVHVMDRGADNFEVYCHAIEQHSEWVVRVTQKQRRILSPDGKRMPLAKYLTTLPLAGTYELSLRARPEQPARTAQVEVRFGMLDVPPPQHQSAYVRRLCQKPVRMGGGLGARGASAPRKPTHRMDPLHLLARGAIRGRPASPRLL